MRLKYRWGIRHVRWLMVLLWHKLHLTRHEYDSTCELYIKHVKDGWA